jgi:glutamate/tyrosine decarboxylase-like PLP-dependent enzyme
MKNIRMSFPEKGTGASVLLSEMKAIKTKDVAWRDGRMFGYIFYPGDDAARAVEEAYRMFCCENALNPSLFVSLKKFENETVQMMTDLLNGGPDASGSLTSGGTESILMALKTARDKARVDHPEIKCPEVVLPESTHPAFNKAAHYFDIKLVHTPVRADKRADVEAMREAVTPNTILLVGSAPCFPHGVIDPLGEIGELALEHKILFHVDACMGGMMLPFAEKLGYPVPPFDFRVPGVTSVSADIHKYGYSPKGASVIIYATRELRKHQFFVYTDWSGGLYGSPTMLGTRCGGPIAAAWASLMYHGLEGFLKMAREVMETSKKIQEGINSIPGLKVVSNPDMSIFAFTSDQFDIFEVGDELSLKRWYLDRIQFPSSLHMTISYHNVNHADEFISAVREAVTKVTADKAKSRSTHFLISFVKGLSKVLPDTWFKKLSSAAAGLMGNKDDERHGMSAAMYGITEKIENRKNVHDLVLDVLDRMY